MKPVELTDFLQVKKSEGYCIVGVEQTANSRSLQHYQFPEKTLLLLGYYTFKYCLTITKTAIGLADQSMHPLTSTQPVVHKCAHASVFPCPCDSHIDKGVSWRGHLALSPWFTVLSLWDLCLSPPSCTCRGMPGCNWLSLRTGAPKINSTNQYKQCGDSSRETFKFIYWGLWFFPSVSKGTHGFLFLSANSSCSEMINMTIIISLCSFQWVCDSPLTICALQPCSWPRSEGEINIYHVCVGVLFCFTLFSHKSVSGAVNLNTLSVSCISSAFAAVRSPAQHGSALISHQVAIISPSCTQDKCSSSNQSSLLRGTL